MTGILDFYYNVLHTADFRQCSLDGACILYMVFSIEAPPRKCWWK